MRIERKLSMALALLVLAGCAEHGEQALGTLEWDRITLPSPAAEKIVQVQAREGDMVAAGAPLLQVELARTASQLSSARALAEQGRERLAELQAGPRQEEIARARASLAAAEATASDARANYRRLQPLGERQLVSRSSVDNARAQADSTEAQARAARAALQELERGTRGEQIAQGAAAAAASDAQADVQAVTLDKLNLVAPRAGRIDSIPYKLGDQPPVGAPLVVMLVGEAPYARVYVPERLRQRIAVGTPATVSIQDGASYAGKVRMIRSEPVFTPYYALSGKDASRLSWLAEISLGKDAAALPAGVPLQAVFETGPDGE